MYKMCYTLITCKTSPINCFVIISFLVGAGGLRRALGGVIFNHRSSNFNINSHSSAVCLQYLYIHKHADI